MSREVHVRFCESVGVRLNRATRLVITGKTKELLIDTIKPAVEKFLRERGLTLSPEKTRITRIEDGFDFLGQHPRKVQREIPHQTCQEQL